MITIYWSRCGSAQLHPFLVRHRFGESAAAKFLRDMDAFAARYHIDYREASLEERIVWNFEEVWRQAAPALDRRPVLFQGGWYAGWWDDAWRLKLALMSSIILDDQVLEVVTHNLDELVIGQHSASLAPSWASP